jgi:hypothetical protein
MLAAMSQCEANKNVAEASTDSAESISWIECVWKLLLRGWNIAGMSAWVISSALALTLVKIPGHFVGWLANSFGAVDFSLLAALVLPALLDRWWFEKWRERLTQSILGNSEHFR